MGCAASKVHLCKPHTCASSHTTQRPHSQLGRGEGTLDTKPGHPPHRHPHPKRKWGRGGRLSSVTDLVRDLNNLCGFSGAIFLAKDKKLSKIILSFILRHRNSCFIKYILAHEGIKNPLHWEITPFLTKFPNQPHCLCLSTTLGGIYNFKVLAHVTSKGPKSRLPDKPHSFKQEAMCSTVYHKTDIKYILKHDFCKHITL